MSAAFGEGKRPQAVLLAAAAAAAVAVAAAAAGSQGGPARKAQPGYPKFNATAAVAATAYVTGNQGTSTGQGSHATAGL